MPELRLSAGILREREKYKAASRDDLDFELNSYQFSVGAVYSIMPGLDLSVGFMQIIYSDAKGTSPVTGSAYGSQDIPTTCASSA
jgi:predicted porin